MESFNTRIQDALIRHQTELERVSALGTKQVLKHLQNLRDELIAFVAQTNPTGVAFPVNQKVVIENLLTQANNLITDTYNKMASTHTSLMTQYGHAEAQIFPKIYNREFGAGVIHPVLTKEAIATIVSEQVFEGHTTKEWWEKQSIDYKYRYKAEMTEGILDGESIDELIERVKDSLVIPQNHAEALSRTGFQNIFQDVRRQIYEGNSDVISQVMWVATLDTRTTFICATLDNRRWRLEDKEPIGHGMKWRGWPPIHWNCRSTTVPITVSYDELNKNLKFNKTVNRLKPGQRASIDGAIPETKSYNDWLKDHEKKGKQGKKDVIEILGVKRYELWKKGKITNVSQLVDQKGNPLTLDELYKKYGKPGG